MQAKPNREEPSMPSSISQGVTVQGARLAEAIMLGIKNIANKNFRMPRGWYALHVGQRRENTDPSVELVIDSCPEVPPALDLPVAAVVGIVFIDQHIRCDAVPHEKWAIQGCGLVCNIISHVSRLPTPIPCTGASRPWILDRDVAAKINAQLFCMQVVKSCELRATASCASSATLGASSSTSDSSVSGLNQPPYDLAVSANAAIACKCCQQVCKSQRGLLRHYESSPICKASHHKRLQLAATQSSGSGETMQPREVHEGAGEVFRDNMRGLVSAGLAKLQLDSLCDNTLRNEMKGLVKGWLAHAGKEIERRLQPLACTSSDKDFLHSVVTECLDVFDGLHTARQEERYLRDTLPYIAPVERELGTHTDWVIDAEGFKHRGKTVKDHCYDLPLAALLARLFQQDSRAWEQVQQSQDEWRALPSSSSEQMVISDIVHGTLFREHPELGEAMIGKLPAAEAPMRLAVGLYYDGLGLSNPLGVAAGRCTHSADITAIPAATTM